MTHLEFDCRDEKAVFLLRASRLYDEGKMHWIPFEMRKMDDEEKEAYFTDCDEILCCELPDDGDEILVSYKNGLVGTDIFGRDDDGCYLESGNEFVTEVTAWMPLPEPYREDGEQNG